MCVAVGDDGKIERSDNGGASWSSMSTLSTERLAAVDCPTVTTCYASGGETAPIDLRSTDGGQSWTSLGTQFVSMNGSDMGSPYCLTSPRWDQ